MDFYLRDAVKTGDSRGPVLVIELLFRRYMQASLASLFLPCCSSYCWLTTGPFSAKN